MTEDFRLFLESIKQTPFQGVSLGNGVRKVRLGVEAKGGGKSGGMRVITYSLNRIDDENIEVTLLYIYDKSEMENVSDQFLAYLMR